MPPPLLIKVPQRSSFDLCERKKCDDITFLKHLRKILSLFGDINFPSHTRSECIIKSKYDIAVPHVLQFLILFSFLFIYYKSYLPTMEMGL